MSIDFFNQDVPIVTREIDFSRLIADCDRLLGNPDVHRDSTNVPLKDNTICNFNSTVCFRDLAKLNLLMVVRF